MIRCLLMLQIFISFREPLALPLLSFLFKGGKKKLKKYTFPQEFSNWEMLEGSCKRKDEVTADMNSDPNFQSAIKMSLLFSLKQLTNYCWTSYLGSGNVSVSLGLRRRWGTGKIWNTSWVWRSLLGGQQCWGQEMPWGAWHCTGVDASSLPTCSWCILGKFFPFFPSQYNLPGVLDTWALPSCPWVSLHLLLLRPKRIRMGPRKSGGNLQHPRAGWYSSPPGLFCAQQLCQPQDRLKFLHPGPAAGWCWALLAFSPITTFLVLP